MKLYHLSHTDLDGYGCQLVLSNYKKHFKKIESFNANYGAEISAKLNEILKDIKSKNSRNIMILITDLNLNMDEANFLEKEVKNLEQNGFKIKLQLLDHHISGQDCADSFDWYYLDVKRSATLITYDYFSKLYGKKDKLEKITQTINAIDLWIESCSLFEFGKVLLRIVSTETREVSTILFPNEARKYKLFMLKKSIKFIDKKNNNILLDNSVHYFKKRFLGRYQKKNTLDNLSSRYLVNILGKKRDEMSIEYKGSRGILTFTIGNISVIANEFLKKYDDEFDFFIDIGFKGSVGLRANNRVDVSKIAKELFGGGGHLNASGGKIKEFKDLFNYNDVKNFIEELIEKKGV